MMLMILITIIVVVLVYNAVVRMCLVEIPGAFQKILSLPATTDLKKPSVPSTDDARWKKIRVDVKNYLTDVLQVFVVFSSSY